MNHDHHNHELPKLRGRKSHPSRNDYDDYIDYLDASRNWHAKRKTDLLFAALGCFALASACLAILIAINN